MSYLKFVTILDLIKLCQNLTRGKNILDLFFTNNSTLIEKSNVIPGISDHDGIPVIVMNTRAKVNKSKPRKVYLYNKANWDNIKKDLSEISYDFEDLSTDLVTVEELWKDFCTRIVKIQEENIPSRMVSPGKKIPWVDHKVKNALRQKHKAYNKARKNDTTENWESFRLLHAPEFNLFYHIKND